MIAYTNYIITLDLGQVGKKAKKNLQFPTNVLCQMKVILHFPLIVSELYALFCFICKGLTTKLTFQL